MWSVKCGTVVIVNPLAVKFFFATLQGHRDNFLQTLTCQIFFFWMNEWMNEMNEFYNLYPTRETRGSSQWVYSSAFDAVSSDRWWQSSKAVSNSSTYRGVRTKAVNTRIFHYPVPDLYYPVFTRYPNFLFLLKKFKKIYHNMQCIVII